MKNIKINSIKKNVLLCMMICMAVLICACGSYAGKVKKHKAVAMFEDGVLSERYAEMSLSDNEERIYRVTYNVNEEMTEKEMLSVLDYEELINNAEHDEATGKILGEMDRDYICFALFCEGNSDNVIGKYKYVNHESVEYTEEDEYLFLNPTWERSIAE